MAFLVMPPIDRPRVRIIRLGRNTEISVVVGDRFPEFPFVVSSVRKDNRSFQVNPAEQFFSRQ